ncbi:hypothetical protein GCM10020000_57070 [Streptomyces olivoverticillatus]|uniref:transposase n=1 Tax=Streptomyces olivoverticillatus TaxID=66427 RepID=UPI001607C45D
MPVLPSWLTEPLWGQFAALLPERSTYAPTHPLGCHRPRISDRTVGLVLVLDQIAVDGSVTKAPGGGEVAGRSPVDRGKQSLKRSGMTDGYGIPLGRVLAGANHHGSPPLAPTLDRLDDLGPLPDDITVHLDAGYDSDKTRAELAARSLIRRAWTTHRWENRPRRRP